MISLYVILLPVLMALLVILARGSAPLVRGLAFLGGIGTFALALFLPGSEGFNAAWLPGIGVSFALDATGAGPVLVLVAALVMIPTLLVAASRVEKGAAGFVALLLLAPLLARGMNALALGEAAAYHMGFRVEALKRYAILLTALATGGAVALTGGIGFVGIIVPHLLRQLLGPDHRLILPGSALMGGVLLVAADVAARSLMAPAEIPIGILTALIGAPVFLHILLRRMASDGGVV